MTNLNPEPERDTPKIRPPTQEQPSHPLLSRLALFIVAAFIALIGVFWRCA